MSIMMKYPKILELGATPILDVFRSDVIVEEKIDGSLFRFGKTSEGTFFMGSKAVDLYEDNIPKMFAKACDFALSVRDSLPEGFVFFTEYLEKPKHNVLTYARVPENNLLLFDVWDGERLNFKIRGVWAKRLKMEEAPVLFFRKIDSAS